MGKKKILARMKFKKMCGDSSGELVITATKVEFLNCDGDVEDWYFHKGIYAVLEAWEKQGITSLDGHKVAVAAKMLKVLKRKKAVKST